ASSQRGSPPGSIEPSPEGRAAHPDSSSLGAPPSQGLDGPAASSAPPGGAESSGTSSSRAPARATGKAPLSDAEFFLEVARWRARHALPRHVFVHTNLNPKPFYVDLGSPLLVDLLRRAVSAIAGQSDGNLYVTEMLPGPD